MIVTVPQAILAAQKASPTIPIVFAVHPDPVGTGLVSSLARPGGNITGLSLMTPDLDGKRLELLKEAFPQASRVAVIWNSNVAGMAPEYMTKKVRIRCARCRTINVSAEVPVTAARRPR